MLADVEAYFRAYRARVYRWAYALCGRHEDALDVVQEVFLRMVRRPPELSVASAAVAWLRQVTSRVVIDRWRAEATRAATQQKYVLHAGPQETPDSRELADRVRAALETLSEQQRLVLMAKTYDRMTFQQIADELGIAVPTAKTHYLRALSAVRARLKNDVQAGRVS
ncbi:MAG: RNA polymerase sigma factor [Phycisphaerae bacterium]